MYVINPDEHSPLIGFAYDGFPIYGAYGYANADGTGGIVRIKSSYQLRNITVRTHYANGNNVTDGPPVNSTYPLGYFREDYEFVAHNTADYLDEHNGRFCVTPEYPNGIYCYFTTVDANHNSAYPYAVGPTFYGNKTASTVTSVSETTTQYTLENADFNLSDLNIKVYPNPAQEFIAIQTDIQEKDLEVTLIDALGKQLQTQKIVQGSTLCIFDLSAVYNGTYFIKIANNTTDKTVKIIVNK